MKYEFEWRESIASEIATPDDMWPTHRMEWMPIHEDDRDKLLAKYAADEFYWETAECTHWLIYDHTGSYEGGVPSRTVSVVPCGEDGTSPKDTPLHEFFCTPAGSSDIDDLWEYVLTCARGGSLV